MFFFTLKSYKFFSYCVTICLNWFGRWNKTILEYFYGAVVINYFSYSLEWRSRNTVVVTSVFGDSLLICRPFFKNEKILYASCVAKVNY